MKTAAVIPALGIGDALLMMIASHHLLRSGYRVVTFHDSLSELGAWFPGQHFQKSVSETDPIDSLTQFDLIVAENDNSARIKQLIAGYKEGKLKQLSIFYPTHLFSKHGLPGPLDQVFDPNLPMAENVGRAIASLLAIAEPSKDNGITPPVPLQHRLHTNRVIIHPTSRVASKNWSPHKFLQLAAQLKQLGFFPHFCVSPAERPFWEKALEIGCGLPHFPNLSSLAEFVFESGTHIGNDSLLGHLASNLNIPTLIIANDAERMRLWRPGWRQGELVLPPQWIPNPRIFRWKKEHWQSLVSVRKVLNAFEKLQCKADQSVN